MTEFGQDLPKKMDVLNQFSVMTENMLEGLNETEFSVEKFLGYHWQLPEYAAPASNFDFPSVSLLKYQSELPAVITHTTIPADSSQETMKREAIQVSEDKTGIGSLEACGNDSSNDRNLKNLQRGRKRRTREKEQEKPAEIVHVRAKRGQATDSHSLAERVRREKINNKLKCLQNLIPGCHQTMGMAMVLDETINYVHSLQNQVEFLSMELQAACSSLGLNCGFGALRKALGTRSHEEQETEKLMRK